MFGQKKVPRHLLLNPSKRKSNISVSLILVAFILVVTITLVLVSASAAADDPPGAGYLQLLHNEQNGRAQNRVRALHLESKANFIISGMVAQVIVTQFFKNNSDQWVEGLYIFPLPEKSAVKGMTLRMGDREILGEIREKAEATRLYKEAKTAGRKVAIVNQQRPNIFSQQVANIAPGETVSVELTYLQTVQYRHGEFSLRFPMTITPRFNPAGTVVDNSEANSDNTGEGKGVLNPITLGVTLDAGFPLASVESDFHNIHINKSHGVHRLEVGEGAVTMDRDFVLRWRPVASDRASAALFSERVDGEDYLMLMVLPPEQGPLQEHNNAEVLPRELTFIIDTSGSMGGRSIVQAKQSLLFALGLLSPQDYFNIIEFNSHHRSLSPYPLEANWENITSAHTFVEGLVAGGGTNMAPALKAAFGQEQALGVLHQIVFITDGAVGNETELFKLIYRDLSDRRLFTLGIGSAPNSYFMRKAAQFGRGSFTHVGDIGQVEKKMNALFEQLRNPVLSNLTVKFDTGVYAELWPQRMPDLYLGEPLIVTAKINELRGKVTVSGSGMMGSTDKWQRTLPLNNSHKHVGVAQLWAREKIASLLDKKTAGANPGVIREEVLAVALPHKLVSPYTSFVAVDLFVSRSRAQSPSGGLKSIQVIHKAPAGVPVSYPRTATNKPLYKYLGLLGLLMFFCLGFLGKSCGIRRSYEK